MFKDDFIWGVACSAYQYEGRDPQDGAGECMWDTFCKSGRVYEQQNAEVTCDGIHRYPEDFRLMGLLGIKAYRFSISWSRILPNGTGEVNPKGIALYRDMLKELRQNGIRPYITLYHWEMPQALSVQGGWMNPESPRWFGEYARIVAENFADLCDDFITINEPQCSINLGYLRGVHAPGIKVSLSETFLAAHHIMMAHGMAVIALRRYAGRPIRVGYSPTCGVAYPETDSAADVDAAKKVYFGFDQPMDNWAWNVAWFSDPVVLGRYPEEGLQKFAEFLPDITEQDMELIHQPIDFLGQNIYNGYVIKAGVNGQPQYVDREVGSSHTDTGWPVTPQCLYWAARFLYERYKLPIYITENGMAAADVVSADGKVHDPERINFLDRYLGELQKAADEGIELCGYFLWSFLDNFEWDQGYSKRFGIVYNDYVTQKRTVKDSAFWYRKIIETNGGLLSVNTKPRQVLFLQPVFTHNIWGGTKLRTEFGYDIAGNDIGECWGIAAHPNGDVTVKSGDYQGMHLSEVWENYPELFGAGKGEQFPLLIKIIDAKDDLSIQVHPDDSYAAQHENGSLGKMECWYVLECEEGSSLVVGHNAGNRQQLCDMIDEGRWQELIREIPIRKGDFVQIDPGTVHAIKGGILLLETQQSSDITYRLYDYDRLQNGKPRQLHLQQSKDVITVPAPSAEESVLHDTVTLEQTHSTPERITDSVRKLENCQYYSVYRINVNGRISFMQDAPFILMTVSEGSGLINGSVLKKGDFFILPAGLGQVEIEGKLQLIASSVQPIGAFAG